MMKSFFGCFLFIVLLTFPTFALSQMKIKVDVEEQNDSIFYLIKYKSDKTHIVIDTTYNNIFSNSENIPEGIYVIADSEQYPIFEILIGKDQKFSIKVKDLMDLKSYKVKGSKETSSYFKVYSQTVHNNLYIKALKSEIEYNPNNMEKIDSLEKSLYDYQESMLSKDNNSFLNTYIKSIEKVIVPQDVEFIEKYIIEHYFDNIPLCDVRILNSRLLKNKLDDFFNNYMKLQSPLYISEQIDNLISKVNDCHEFRDYILWYLYSKYFKTDNVDDEFVFIHLVDNYFSKLEISNLTQNIRDEIVKRTNILKNITIGHTAPTLLFFDDEGNEVNLYDIQSNYIVLFFYKPECQRCIRDKRILGLVEKRRKDLKVIRIDISDEEKYQEIIETYDLSTTPEIFILDKDKKIIDKDVSAERIEFYITEK